MGTQLPQEGAQQPHHLSAHVYCGQTDGWIKVLLGTEVGLGPGDIVLDWDPLPHGKGHSSPSLFGPCLLWPNGRPSQQLLSFCLIQHSQYSGIGFRFGVLMHILADVHVVCVNQVHG